MDETNVNVNSFKAWVLASRPKTLSGAAVPVLITLCCELYKLINLKVSDTPKKPKAGIFDTDEE